MASRSTMFICVQVVTFIRVPLAIVICCLLPMSSGNELGRWICIALLGVAELTDAVDGWMARRFNQTSQFGAMADPYADSISRLIVYWGLSQVGLILAVVPLVMAVRDVTVAYCRLIWTRLGSPVNARISGKLKAVAQGAAAFVVLVSAAWWPESLERIVLTSSWFVIAATVYSGTDYVAQTARLTTAQSSPDDA